MGWGRLAFFGISVKLESSGTGCTIVYSLAALFAVTVALLALTGDGGKTAGTGCYASVLV